MSTKLINWKGQLGLKIALVIFIPPLLIIIIGSIYFAFYINNENIETNKNNNNFDADKTANKIYKIMGVTYFILILLVGITHKPLSLK